MDKLHWMKVRVILSKWDVKFAEDPISTKSVLRTKKLRALKCSRDEGVSSKISCVPNTIERIEFSGNFTLPLGWGVAVTGWNLRLDGVIPGIWTVCGHGAWLRDISAEEHRGEGEDKGGGRIWLSVRAPHSEMVYSAPNGLNLDDQLAASREHGVTKKCAKWGAKGEPMEVPWMFELEIDQLADEYELGIRKKGHMLDDIWENYKKVQGDNTYWWYDQKSEEEERREIGTDIEGYDPPSVHVETFKIKRYSFDSGQSFICVTKELMDALPLGKENESRFREIIRKEVDSGRKVQRKT
ncbi:hypothetical protein Tco_1166214 [Tanacetum coccineum]